ncbi:nitrate/nitrite transporter NrtS [Paraglaciecola polaris]|uniref:Phosphoenolpyruvate-protein kinase n=1 Tax=Paraglaciecola polaris LMG 21857 TaxID=1129793 RepID=K6ZZP1_9ALTE|nr:nitrate/nitrite transporter NrtS [Paraglaciecola polaris]GAC34208.1 phosphoenolpyruvate-protein kinase [Paraglaciecola polaris LMG 21857]
MPQVKLTTRGLLFRPDIRNRSIKVALVVGTLLGLINHGDNILMGTITLADILKILISYFVPYSVSTWSAIQTAKDDFQKQHIY